MTVDNFTKFQDVQLIVLHTFLFWYLAVYYNSYSVFNFLIFNVILHSSIFSLFLPSLFFPSFLSSFSHVISNKHFRYWNFRKIDFSSISPRKLSYFMETMVVKICERQRSTISTHYQGLWFFHSYKDLIHYE